MRYKYNTIDELDARIERIVDSNVKNYYTDWKNYDRPKYMKLKSSNDRKDKQIILIARECGTYLLTLDQILTNEAAMTIYDYFQTNEDANYYHIDLNDLTVLGIVPEKFNLLFHAGL